MKQITRYDYDLSFQERVQRILPKNKPQIVTVPPMNYIAVRGKGDPNEEGGAYKAAIGMLWPIPLK